MELSYSTPLEVLAELGKRLKSHRISQKLTQAEVAQRANVSVMTVSNLEKGSNTSFLVVVTVAQVLGLGADLNHLFRFIPLSIDALESAEKMPQRVRGGR